MSKKLVEMSGLDEKLERKKSDSIQKSELTAQERSATGSGDFLPAASQPKEEKMPSKRNNSPRHQLTPYTRHTLQYTHAGSYRIPNPYGSVSIDPRRFHLPSNSPFFNKHLNTSSKGKPILSLDKYSYLYKDGLKGPGQSQ